MIHPRVFVLLSQLFLVITTYTMISCSYFQFIQDQETDDNDEDDHDTADRDLYKNSGYNFPPPRSDKNTGKEDDKIKEQTDSRPPNNNGQTGGSSTKTNKDNNNHPGSSEPKTLSGRIYQRLCHFLQCDHNGDQVADAQLPLVNDQLSIGIALNSRHEISPFEASDPTDPSSDIPEAKPKYVEFIFVIDNTRHSNHFSHNCSAYKTILQSRNNIFIPMIQSLVDLQYAIDYSVIEVPTSQQRPGSISDSDFGNTAIDNSKIHRIPLPSNYFDVGSNQKLIQKSMLYQNGSTCSDTNKHLINCIRFSTAKPYYKKSDIFSGLKKAIDQIKTRRSEGSDDQAIINKRKFYVVVLLTEENPFYTMNKDTADFNTLVDRLIDEKINPSDTSQKLKFRDRIKFINIVTNIQHPMFELRNYDASVVQDKRTKITHRLASFKEKIDQVMGENSVINFYNQTPTPVDACDPPAADNILYKAFAQKPTDIEIKDLSIDQSIFSFINKSFPTLILQCLLDKIKITATTQLTAEQTVKDSLENADFTKDDNDEYKNVYIWHDVLEQASSVSSVNITTDRCCVDMHSQNQRGQYEENGELLHPLEYFSRPNNYPSIDDTNNICHTTSTKTLTFNIGSGS